MATRRLTINLFDFTDQAVGIPVTLQLEGVTQAAAEGALPNRYIIPHAQTAHTNKDGVAIFDIEPTQNLQGNPRPQYRVSWTGGPHAGLLFNMPDAHSSLYTIVQQPTIPPDPGTLPINPQEGDYIVFSNSQWSLGSPSHVGTSPPQAPAQGGLWFDTSSSPADIRWYNAGRWEEVRDPADIAAALNSLTGPDRVSGRHIADQIPVPLVETLPAITGYQPGDYIGVQAAGQSASVDVYILSRTASRTLTDRNRLQFVIANNVVQATPPATDNYRDFLGSIVYRTVGRDAELSIRLDTGLGVEVPDQLWLRGIEAANALSEFRVDIAQPYSYSGGRRYKQLNNLVSAAVRAAGINGPQTWLLFDDLGGTSPFQFKPATERIGSRWVGLGGGGSPGMGGGLNQAQVDARIQIGVADWAETGNTDDIPAAKLPPIGTSELANDAVTADKIADNAVTADHIATGAVGGTEIAPDSVGTSELANNAVTNIKMADDAIGSAELAANAVDTAALADDSVTPAKLDADNATKQAAMRTRIGAEASGHTHPAAGAGSIGTTELADGAVTTAKLADDAVTNAKVADDAVRTDQIQNAAVTEAKLAAGAVSEGRIRDNAVTTRKIAAGAVTDAKLARDAALSNVNASSSIGGDLGRRIIPSGGATGQVITKTGSGNYQFGWRTASAGGASSLVGLSDTPSALGTAGEILAVASGGASTEWVGQAMAGLDLTTVQAWRTYANSTSSSSNLSAATILPSGFANDTSAVFVQGAFSATQVGVAIIPIDAITGVTGNQVVASCSIAGQGAATLRYNSATRGITIQGWQAAHRPRIQYVALIGSGAASGGGLTQTQVDARVQALVENFAEVGNAATIPSAKLASGGTDGQVLTRTATGQAWEAASGGLNQAAVDGRVQALVENFAEVGVAGTIPTARIADDAVTQAKLAAGAVGSTELANDAVTAAKINTGAVGASELAAGAVGTGAIANNAVTTAQLANNAVETAKIGDDQVTQAKLADDAVGADQLASNAVVTASLADDAVTLDKIANAVTARLLPAGGTEDQALVKSSDSDYATEWGDVAAGGGSPLTVTALESRFTPSLASTNIGTVGEYQVSIAAGTIDTHHPFSVSSNGIVVAAGTTTFQAALDYVLEIDPTGWVNGSNEGGNRLFIDIYWKKDGTILPETRASYYVRGHEGWAPTVHKLHGNFTEDLSPGTYTLWINRTIAAAAGNEIRDIQISGTNSVIRIDSERYTGGGGTGADTFLALTDTPAAFGTAGQSLRVNTARNQLEFFTPATGGLDQAAVDARVTAGTKVFARTGGRQIQGSDIGTGQIASAQIADATIVSGDIAANSITAANLAPNSVGASELANNAVDSGAIAANAVTAAKIASNAVTTAKIAANAVTTAKVGDNQVTIDKIADAVVARLLPSTGGSAGQVLTWPQTGSNPAWAAAAGGGGAVHVVSAWDAQATTQVVTQQTNVLALTYESSRTLSDYDYLEVVLQGPTGVEDTFFWIPVVTLTNIGTATDTFSRVANVINPYSIGGSSTLGLAYIQYAHGGTVGSRIRGHPRGTPSGGSGAIWTTRIRYCALVRFS